MTLDEFTAALEQELRLRGVGFTQAEVFTFAADVWSLAEEDPEPVRWAQAFIDRGQGELRA